MGKENSSQSRSRTWQAFQVTGGTQSEGDGRQKMSHRHRTYLGRGGMQGKEKVKRLGKEQGGQLPPGQRLGGTYLFFL
jgi:hypothetical protein